MITESMVGGGMDNRTAEAQPSSAPVIGSAAPTHDWVITRIFKETFSARGRTRQEAYDHLDQHAPGAATTKLISQSAKRVR